MFRTILKLLTALALGASASAGLAQTAAPASPPVPHLKAQAAPPAAATPAARAEAGSQPPAQPSVPSTSTQSAVPSPAASSPSAAAPAASTPDAGGDNAKSLKSTMAVPHDLSPWSMFLSADVIVKAVMIGLAFASLVTWTIFIAKMIELSVVQGKLRRSLKTISESRSL
ncbi:MAG TPA: tonB-system energizer ExbB, partial [Xanthobacteraceae bacterium]